MIKCRPTHASGDAFVAVFVAGSNLFCARVLITIDTAWASTRADEDFGDTQGSDLDNTIKQERESHERIQG